MKLNRIIAFLGCVLLAAGWGCNSGTNTNTAEKSTDAGTTSAPERHRPQFHFTPPAKWMNDPNGMVYHNGEYHLFYQHNPDTTVWAPMHWGHAVSKDLVHWEHLPIALYPDSLGMIFSGSAVVDVHNTSGLGSKENPAMVAIFTYHDMPAEKAGRIDYQTQGIAFSLDNGRTWKKYAGNPVLKNPGIKDFRDPKVSWHEKSKKWIMALAVADHIRFYSSPDLKNWQAESQFGKNIGAHGGVWECPDLFKLPVAGTPEEKWVLLVSINPGGPNGGSATQYFIGDFDGKQFVLDESFRKDLNGRKGEGIWVDYGTDNYAGVTWNNVPAADGRRLFLGWMSNWLYANVVPTQTWRSAMTVPRELKLQRTASGYRLLNTPVKELQSLRTSTTELPAQEVDGSLDLSKKYNLNSPLLELELNLDLAQSPGTIVRFANDQGEHVDVGYSVAAKQLYIDRAKSGNMSFSDKFSGKYTAPLTLNNGQLKLHLLLDVASVEVFANDGQAVMTGIFFPTENFTNVSLISSGKLRLANSKAYALKSIWK